MLIHGDFLPRKAGTESWPEVGLADDRLLAEEANKSLPLFAEVAQCSGTGPGLLFTPGQLRTQLPTQLRKKRRYFINDCIIRAPFCLGR